MTYERIIEIELLLNFNKSNVLSSLLEECLLEIRRMKALRKKNESFVAPTIDEVAEFFLKGEAFKLESEKKACQFVDYYAAKDWKVGSTKMVDWKAAGRVWEARAKRPSSVVDPKISVSKEPRI